MKDFGGCLLKRDAKMEKLAVKTIERVERIYEQEGIEHIFDGDSIMSLVVLLEKHSGELGQIK